MWGFSPYAKLIPKIIFIMLAGVSKSMAMFLVFFFSAIFHEVSQFPFKKKKKNNNKKKKKKKTRKRKRKKKKLPVQEPMWG